MPVRDGIEYCLAAFEGVTRLFHMRDLDGCADR